MHRKGEFEMKVKHTLVEWEDRFVIGIPIVDKQHQRLVELTNDLYLACLQNTETANRRFMEALHEAVEYVRYHFSTEEKMMLLLEFPDYVTHKKEHESFILEILAQTKKFTIKNHLVPNRFVHYLKEWILSHIALCDKAMADFFLHTKYHEKLVHLFPRSAKLPAAGK